MWNYLSQLLEMILESYSSLQGILNWIWDAVVSFFNAFVTFNLLIPTMFGIYLPSGLVAIFIPLIVLSVVMAVMAAVGSNVRR